MTDRYATAAADMNGYESPEERAHRFRIAEIEAKANAQMNVNAHKKQVARGMPLTPEIAMPSVDREFSDVWLTLLEGGWRPQSAYFGYFDEQLSWRLMFTRGPGEKVEMHFQQGACQTIINGRQIAVISVAQLASLTRS